MALVAHGPAIWGGFVWDDDMYVQNNPTLRTGEGLIRIWTEPGATPQYYPLVFTSFWLEYRLYGVEPWGYHFVNLLLHATSAVLFWLVLRRLEVPGAWLAAALFAVHPVMVESVAWITERKNVLSGVFYWGAFLAFLRFFGIPDRESKDGWGYYVLALGLFACALWSKTVTCSLPAVLVLVLWWKEGRVSARQWLGLAPMFLLGAVMAAVTIWMEASHVGAQGREWEFTLVERVLIAGRAVWFYAQKLIWPVDLTFFYPRWQIDETAAWQYVFPVGVLALLVALWLSRRHVGTGPLVAVLCFVGTLFPALGFINVYPMLFSFVADHFQYLASAALFVLGAALAVRFWPVHTPQARNFGYVLTGGILALLAVLTWRQATIYRDRDTLWTDTLAKNPDSWAAHYNLGQVRSERGREQRDPALVESAIEHYEQALRLRPELVDAHHQIGVALIALDRLPQAMPRLQKAVELQPDRPLFHRSLGSALALEGKKVEAVRHFRRCLELDPQDADARFFLGVSLGELGEYPEAIEHLSAFVRIQPDHGPGQLELGKALLVQGRPKDAARALREAVRLLPEHPDYLEKLADALRQDGQYDEAREFSTRARRLRLSEPGR